MAEPPWDSRSDEEWRVWLRKCRDEAEEFEERIYPDWLFAQRHNPQVLAQQRLRWLAHVPD